MYILSFFFFFLSKKYGTFGPLHIDLCSCSPSPTSTFCLVPFFHPLCPSMSSSPLLSSPLLSSPWMFSLSSVFSLHSVLSFLLVLLCFTLFSLFIALQLSCSFISWLILNTLFMCCFNTVTLDTRFVTQLPPFPLFGCPENGKKSHHWKPIWL